MSRGRAKGLFLIEATDASATQRLKPKGQVRVTCSVGFDRRYVLPQWPAFYSAYVGLQIELSLNDQIVDLVREGLDIGIRGGNEPAQGMVARKICALR